MRFYEKILIKVSEDANSDPKLIRFAEEAETTDVALLPEAMLRQEAFPIGVAIAIPLGNIAQGRFLYIRSDKAVTFTLNGGSPLALRPNLSCRMWVDFTSLAITTTVASNVVIFAAGA